MEPYKPYYEKKNIEILNDFITNLNNLYHMQLNTKNIFYSSLCSELNVPTIELNHQNIEPKETTSKPPRPTIPHTNENRLVEYLDNMWLKEYPDYIPKTLNIEKSNYYLNEQYGFYDSINEILKPLLDYDKGEDSCNKTKEFNMLQHQKIVQNYLNIYTPYRGLLLFHGLGSGKTCSSISILEGLKQQKEIYIMTPASLQKNYKTQMKFCGDIIFRNNNHWVFVKTDDLNSIYKLLDEYLILHHKKSEKIRDYMKKYKGVWLIKKEAPNYDIMSSKDKQQINEWIDVLMDMKYNFINYNGIKKKKWELLKTKSENPFENSVIIIDEAHNFVSQINNKIRISKSSISTEMYECIMKAENCKIILLSGTPYINNPSELGVMINLISGYTIVFEIIIENMKDKPEIIKRLNDDITKFCSVKINGKKITIIRNPHGFINTPEGVKYQKDSPFINNELFLENIKQIMKGMKIIIEPPKKYKRIPDDEKEFNQLFVKVETSGKNQGLKVIDRKNKFQTRIAGMISYLGDKTSLMPKLKTNITEYIPMSGHQKSEYKKYESKEGKMKSSKGDTSYKIFTRAACNFVFGDKELERPFPDKITNEKDFDYTTMKEQINEVDALIEDGDDMIENKKYDKEIDIFIKNIHSNLDYIFYNNLPRQYDPLCDKTEKPNEEEYGLYKHSPKFAKILENIIKFNNSCQLLYTSFRRIEGIEMLKILLKYQGYMELVLKKDKSGDYNIELEGFYDIEKCYQKTGIKNKVFALYTGTEEKEVKEIIRNIYNSDLNHLSPKILITLEKLYGGTIENLHGELIQLLMITASGAEGIDLQNTKYVHIVEPYWHYVRIEQVIGRARRICSHNRLPIEEQYVKVIQYISTMDTVSTDQYLETIMNNKKVLSESFLNTLKEVAIDCNGSKCFRYPLRETTIKQDKVFEYDLEKEKLQKPELINLKFTKRLLFYNGKKDKFDVDEKTNMVYKNGQKIGLLLGDKVV